MYMYMYMYVYVYVYRSCIEEVKVTSNGLVAANATTGHQVRRIGANNPSGCSLTRDLRLGILST